MRLSPHTHKVVGDVQICKHLFDIEDPVRKGETNGRIESLGKKNMGLTSVL